MKIDNYELNHPDRIDTPAMITYRPVSYTHLTLPTKA